MANLQVRNVPDSLHENLRRHAKENNRTMSEVVVTAVERELTRWEWLKRLESHPRTNLGVSAADLLAEERNDRDAELASLNTSLPLP